MSTPGTVLTSTSRITPPPIAVMVPTRIAVSGVWPAANAIAAPFAVKSPSPNASNTTSK